MPNLLRIILALCAATCCGGCVTRNVVTLEATSADTRLTSPLPVAVYRSTVGTGVDFLLTDLTLDELDPATDPATLSGRIIRVSMLVRPRPGATPIDPTAANATVQYLLLSRGAIGLYSGGAFVNPGQMWGADTMTVRVRDGTLRLTAGTASFRDLLGPTTMRAEFAALPDEALAARAASKLEQIVAGLLRAREMAPDKPVDEQPDAPPP